MPRPCHRKHATIDPTCDFCRAAMASKTLQRKWDCEAECREAVMEAKSGVATEKTSDKLRNPPRSICAHRGDRIGTCAGCGGLPKYACTVFGETTATKCLSCDRHTEREGRQMVELGLPPIPRPDGVRYHDPATGTIREMRVEPPIPGQLPALSPETLTRLLQQAQAGPPRAGVQSSTGELRWISTARLARDTLALIGNLPLYQLANGKAEPIASGSRGSEPAAGKLLVVDDTVYRGSAIVQARATLKDALFAAVYVRPEAAGVVDFHAELLPSPHLCEWNLFNNGTVAGQAANPIFGAGLATDFDGILCEEPQVPDADDGPGLERYRQWLINARPGSLLPRKHPIPLIVTGRLERFRAETEEWLKRHRVKWDKLVMHPADKASERKNVGEWKGRIFAESRCGFFVESDPRQAPTIAEVSGKPVICPVQEKVYRVAKRVAVAVPEGVPTVVTGRKYPEITVRHLCYFVGPISGNQVWQRNLDQLKKRIELFNGRKIIAVATHTRGTPFSFDPPEAVERHLRGLGCEFIRVPNDPTIRERAAWVPLLEPLQGAGESEAIWFGHTKGNTHGDHNAVNRWVGMMYRGNLDCWSHVEKLLGEHPVCGMFKRVGLPAITGHRPAKPNGWEYSGTFFWLRAAELFRRNWRGIERNRYGVEAAPGDLFRVDEGGAIYPPQPIGTVQECSLYEEAHASRAEKGFEEFARSHSARPTEPKPDQATRHLCYCIYPVSGNGTWQLNIDRLLPHLGLFDGRRRIAVLTHSPATRHPLDSVETVRRYILDRAADDRFEFFDRPNNPSLREGEVWGELFEPLRSSGANGLAFFAHSKAVTREPGNGAHIWRDIMYRALLGEWSRVAEMLRKFPLVGCFKHVGVNFLRTPSRWQFLGSFYWLKLSEMFKRDWRRTDPNWCAVETWPGLHYRPEEGGMLFPTYEMGNLHPYDARLMQRMEREFEAWRLGVVQR
jgi:uncharacterized HAD superfamily protein